MASFSARKTSLKAMWVTVLLVVTTAALIAPPPTAEAVISCNSVLTTLSPCLNFVMFGGDVPSTECCYGVKFVYNAATTKEDRQAVCSCLKSVANSATPSMIKNAAEIPGKCGVSLPYVISPSTDCSKYVHGELNDVNGVGMTIFL
ncbi:non-specific lipid-transfer protein 1-like [Primulina tabacum]|uniref:non-specific lipid-transfer protein 1-like n=1 Tax=Primulina tabacum TaxID=48773 RepID=UPI003F593718